LVVSIDGCRRGERALGLAAFSGDDAADDSGDDRLVRLVDEAFCSVDEARTAS
jgi:hypothetical protein